MVKLLPSLPSVHGSSYFMPSNQPADKRAFRPPSRNANGAKAAEGAGLNQPKTALGGSITRAKNWNEDPRAAGDLPQ
jgi:hypothetical protein